MKVGNRMKGGRREDRINARFERMVARVNKLESENRRLKEVLMNAGIDEWHVPDPLLQKRFDDIINKAKSDQMHDIREKSFKWRRQSNLTNLCELWKL